MGTRGFSKRAATGTDTSTATRTRVLWLSCAAHALHDGYTDALYVLLPVWQAEFGLSYGAVATLRGIYAGAMALLQLPVGRLASRLGSRSTLALGTLLAACGYGALGTSGSLLGLCTALAISGAGSSTQHPLASAAVSHAYGRDARAALGIYNFAGDLGKVALPAACSLMITLMPWRHALWPLAVLGCAAAALLVVLFPAIPRQTPVVAPRAAAASGTGRAGFALLLVIGVLDIGVRMGMLTFLPFLLEAKGLATSMVGTALALVFVGGAAGKITCGWLGARLGFTGTVLATEVGTAACIGAVMFCPLPFAMILLPLLGLMLNGTSSVLYGTVPELAPPDGVERAFSMFYTGTFVSSALAPFLYGLLADHIGVSGSTLVTALTALMIAPLALVLGRGLAQRQAVQHAEQIRTP
jgi:MFS family permease